MTPAPKKTRLRKLTHALILLLLTLLTIELLFRIAAAAGLVHIRPHQTVNRTGDIKFIGDLNPHFGVWHVPNATIPVRTPGATITYETNAHGMRDRPRTEKSNAPERIIVLGDSFIEGPYVEAKNRITDQLETQTGIEFLNFGVSGNFGSIQESLLYQHLATRFDHTRVLIFHLPDNDFSDNDPTRHRHTRYRPYLRKTNDTFQLYYTRPFNDADANLRQITTRQKIKNWIRNHSYTLNVTSGLNYANLMAPWRASTLTSAYDEYTPTDLELLLHTYTQIIQRAHPRPVTLFIIPRDRDILAHQAGNAKGRIVQDLTAYAATNKTLTIVDLLPPLLAHMKQNNHTYKKYFLPFDDHWSPLGHRTLADIVHTHLPNLKTTPPTETSNHKSQISN